MTSGKWKSKLLSSGVPLEYEVAKELVRRGFSVASDFSYQRNDAPSDEDFSVDVDAFWLVPVVKGAGGSCSLTLLIECKYRHPGVAWLFLPDPNTGSLSFTTWGHKFRVVDSFSRWFVHRSAERFERHFVPCYKGVEVDIDGGGVDDSRLRHGLYQLQYALPALLAERIRSAAIENPVDNMPFMFLPILVTTAPLVVAKRGLNMRRLQSANALRDIGTEIPYVSVYVTTGSEFEKHVAAQCAGLPKRIETETMREVEEQRRVAGASEYDLPSLVTTCLAFGIADATLDRPFNQIVVCSFAFLGELLTLVKDEALRINNSVRLYPKGHKR
jgi:hypothetical protein